MAVKPKPLFGGARGCVPAVIAVPKLFSFLTRGQTEVAWKKPLGAEYRTYQLN